MSISIACFFEFCFGFSILFLRREEEEEGKKEKRDIIESHCILKKILFENRDRRRILSFRSNSQKGNNWDRK